MIVPPLTNWNVGEEPTSAMFNARIRDAINFLKAPPMGVFRRSTTQPTSSGIWTPVQWNVEDLDTDGGHSNVTNPSRYTAQTEGYYLCASTVEFQGNSTGFRDARFRKNADNTRFWGWNTIEPDVGHGADVAIFAYIPLQVGDYVEVMAKQTSGGTLNIGNDGLDSRLEVRWVSKL